MTILRVGRQKNRFPGAGIDATADPSTSLRFAQDDQCEMKRASWPSEMDRWAADPESRTPRMTLREWPGTRGLVVFEIAEGFAF